MDSGTRAGGESRGKEGQAPPRKRYAQNHYTHLEQQDVERFPAPKQRGADALSEVPSYYRPLVDL